MYRKPRRRAGGEELDLDSLMDILSCLVGVMLFLVIYTVLELGSVAYQADVVVSPEPRANGRRAMVLTDDGRIRTLDVRRPLGQLLNGFDIVRTPAEVELFVETSQSVSDRYFTYELQYVERSTTDLLGFVDLVIDERTDAQGETRAELDRSSAYAGALSELDPLLSWVSFAVDTTSIEAFRVAREMAIDRGLATRFDLLTLDFPVTLPLSSANIEDPLAGIVTLTKPLR